MAATATATLTITTIGLTAGQITFAPAAVTLNTPVGSLLDQNLSTGANTITVPAGTKYIGFVPPSGNASAITLKGVSGDTGIPLDPVNPSVIAVNYPSGGTLVLTAAGTINGFSVFFF